MNVLAKYELSFRMVNNTPAVDSNEESAILSHFLMMWDSQDEIVLDLIPLIDRGIKYGTVDRLKTYDEIPELKNKMLERWKSDSRIENKIESWNAIKDRKGYYIKEEGLFLEGIDAGSVGLAFVTADNTVLTGSDLGLPDKELPSVDFKEIVLHWLQFLRNKNAVV